MNACVSGTRSTNYPLSMTLAATIVAGIIPLALAGPVTAGEDEPSVDYHDFKYNPENETYQVNGNLIPLADVQRDLNGALCGRCHIEELEEIKQSVHYRLQNRSSRVLFPGGGGHGALDRACGLPGTTALTNYTSDVNLGECSKCHTGRFLPPMEGAFASMFTQMGLPDPAKQASDLVNAGIDCLICHAGVYTAVPEGTRPAGYAEFGEPSPVAAGYAKTARDDTDFNRDGLPDLLLDTTGDGVADAPLMLDGNGDGIPDTPWPTVAQDRSPEAVTSTGLSNEHTCLRCHEHARTGYKRATLFADGYDVHASADSGPFAGVQNRCTVCHRVVDDMTEDGDQNPDPDHRFVRGHDVGGDLMAADFAPPAPGIPADPDDPTHLTCVQCHQDLVEASRSENESVHSARHLDVIACQACHIPHSGGITYSMNGQGGHIAFGRNAQGQDTRVITADHMLAQGREDVAADFEAYRMTPTLVWFNGGTSFLAQSLAVRGSPNAKIFPFKPMANGMVFDARFFQGHTLPNAAGYEYNGHSMYRFFANYQDDCESWVCGNAEVFAAMDMLDLTPEEVRTITPYDFMSDDPNRMAMAMMQIFPNMIYFDKATFGYEHYLIAEGSVWDANEDGFIDPGQDFMFDMFAAANSGLGNFQRFNIPMMLPLDYQWYPAFDSKDQLVTMKLPDGSLMKMFLQMQASRLPPELVPEYLAAVDNYPAFSNGITLGGHGVRPKEQALGAGRKGCQTCHGEYGVLTTPVPVTRKVPTNLGDMGTVELPIYQWKFYNMRALVNLGLATSNEDLVVGSADVDVLGDPAYVRTSGEALLLNWFMPNLGRYLPASDDAVLNDTGLNQEDLTINNGRWMPVLEPVVDYVPNYAVLGYQREEIIFKPKPGKGKSGGQDKGNGRKTIQTVE